jgi:hypothetical protein
MILVVTNRVRRLLHLSYIGHVSVEDLQQIREELVLLLEDLPAGFTLLTDLSHLGSMDSACEAEIAQVMELSEQKGIGTVVRVIPDPQKDIGFNILTAFHYSRQVKVVTCKSMEEAIRSLGVSGAAAGTLPDRPDVKGTKRHPQNAEPDL